MRIKYLMIGSFIALISGTLYFHDIYDFILLKQLAHFTNHSSQVPAQSERSRQHQTFPSQPLIPSVPAFSVSRSAVTQTYPNHPCNPPDSTQTEDSWIGIQINHLNCLRNNRVAEAVAWAERGVKVRENLQSLGLLLNVLIRNQDTARALQVQQRMKHFSESLSAGIQTKELVFPFPCPQGPVLEVSYSRISSGPRREVLTLPEEPRMEIKENGEMVCTYSVRWAVLEDAECPVSATVQWKPLPQGFRSDTNGNIPSQVGSGEIGTHWGQIPYCAVSSKLTYPIPSELLCTVSNGGGIPNCRSRGKLNEFSCGYFLNSQVSGYSYIPTGESKWIAEAPHLRLLLRQLELVIGDKKLYVCEESGTRDNRSQMMTHLATHLINHHRQAYTRSSSFIKAIENRFELKDAKGESTTHYYCEATDLFQEKPCTVYKHQSVFDPTASCEEQSTDIFLAEKVESLMRSERKQDAKTILGIYDCLDILSQRMTSLIQSMPESVKNSCSSFSTRDYPAFQFLEKHPELIACTSCSICYCTCKPSVKILDPIRDTQAAEERRYHRVDLDDELGQVEGETEGSCGDGYCPSPEKFLSNVHNHCAQFKSATVRAKIRSEVPSRIHVEDVEARKRINAAVKAVLEKDCK